MLRINLETVESTHKYAIHMVESQVPRDCVITAVTQTNGIGRCHRHWSSARGNLFMSTIKKVSFKDIDFGKISLVTACAVREAISEYLLDDRELKLHWPNDIHYKNLKISGILLTKIGDWLVTSVGLNIHPVPDIESSISMTELKALGVMPKQIPLACELSDDVVKQLDKWLLIFEKFGFYCIKDYWLSHIREIGRLVTIKNGNESLSGVFSGIDDLGRIVLEKKNNIRLLISSGDLFLNPKGISVKYE